MMTKMLLHFSERRPFKIGHQKFPFLNRIIFRILCRINFLLLVEKKLQYLSTVRKNDDKNNALFITFCEEECFEIVPQSDGDDGEVCAEGEDGEEAEEVVDGGQVPGLTSLGLEVQCVQVVDLREGKNTWGKRKKKKK